MATKTEWVDIAGKHGTFGGFLAHPGKTPAPGVIVIQEVFGVNPHIQEVTQRFAEAGYAALAPDLFWPVQHKFSTGYSGEDLEKARAARAKISPDKAVDDVAAAIQLLRSRPEAKGRKIGVVGYCWGGLITYLTAVRHQPDAAAPYYGGGIVNYLGEVNNLKNPTMFHFGEKDASIPLDQVEQIRKAVQEKKDVQVFTYKDAQHGFTCDHRASFHPEASKVAMQRTLEFFGKHLK
ncbi:MAG: dienelactone hydrolase family protein [Candidatus Lambdaproteobacteria bacterium]|nr:dienelactone hydrolase family protein [Candidatus Lambdaproteobacteria bacterium]